MVVKGSEHFQGGNDMSSNVVEGDLELNLDSSLKTPTWSLRSLGRWWKRSWRVK